MAFYARFQAGGFAHIQDVAIAAQKAIHAGSIRQALVVFAREWVTWLFSTSFRRYGRRKPRLQLLPSDDSACSELRTETAPNERGRLHVAERTARQIQAVTQIAGQGAQR